MESDLIHWLRRTLPTADAVRLGLGDDAAVVRFESTDLVVTTDMLMEGVDFRLEEVDARRVGYKILAVNLSDMAAMAARPVAASSVRKPSRLRYWSRVRAIPLSSSTMRTFMAVARRVA